MTARMSQCRYLHGAVIAQGNRIIGMAHNVKVTHPIQKRYRYQSETIHAEIKALILTQSSVVGATLYSARISRDGEMKISTPCATCTVLLIDAGISTIVYYDGTAIVKEKL